MRFPEFWSSTFWRRGGAQRTAQETAVLDNAFALIDGQCNNLKKARFELLAFPPPSPTLWFRR